MYRIETEPVRNLIVVTLSGMLDLTETAAYMTELGRVLGVSRFGGYRLLLDVSGCAIQSQDMLRAMGEHMATIPRASSIAVVTGSSLARMQVRRLFKQPYCRIVSTQAAGRAWVIDGIEPAGEKLKLPQS